MGTNARVNNEWTHNELPYIPFNMRENEKKSDMEVLRISQEAYNARSRELEDLIEQNPNISDKFIFTKNMTDKYELAFELLQRRFILNKVENQRFDPQYMEYVMNTFSLSNESVYTFTRDFRIFTRDYIGYIKEEVLDENAR